MAKPGSHRIGSGPLKSGSMVKKKTPSELRVGCGARTLNLVFAWTLIAFSFCDYYNGNCSSYACSLSMS